MLLGDPVFRKQDLLALKPGPLADAVAASMRRAAGQRTVSYLLLMRSQDAGAELLGTVRPGVLEHVRAAVARSKRFQRVYVTPDAQLYRLPGALPAAIAMTTTSDLRALWPPVLLFSALVAGVLAFANLDSPLRAVIVLWFMLVCPAWRSCASCTWPTRWPSSPSASRSASPWRRSSPPRCCTRAPWSPQAVLAVLIAATVAGVGLDVGRRRA